VRGQEERRGIRNLELFSSLLLLYLHYHHCPTCSDMKRSNPSTSSQSSRQPSQSRVSQKKTRFVSPEDDPSRFAEDVDSQLENSKRSTRKGRVKTEGYESDSSDDGEGVVRSRKKEKHGEDEDEDDMFAVGDKADDKVGEAEPEAAKKKKTEYLRLGDIEGQEFNDNEGMEDEGEEDSASEEEPEDMDDAERRKKAGMGFELSSFNMREEMEEGKFTEDGSFVRTFDPHAMHDRWLDDTDERDMKKARRAKRAQEKAERSRVKAEAKEAQETGRKEEMERELLEFLKRGESVLEALARLGEKARKAKEKEKKYVQ
jgi:CD2 antigen cytoplasmic tail-binding protein 2